MTREIKFRAWDKNKSNMVSFHLLSMSDHLGNRLIEGDFEIMQYTGLKDKNGKEIYEGDILRANGGTIGKIEFKFDGFQYTGFGSGLYGNTHVLEIIGNIYENPELLK